MSQGQDAEWRPMVAFEDQSASYVHGYEAGMIWQQMQDEHAEIDVIVHLENKETLRSMADAAGYEMAYLALPEAAGWASVSFRRRPRRGPLSVVK